MVLSFEDSSEVEFGVKNRLADAFVGRDWLNEEEVEEEEEKVEENRRR